MAFIAKRLSEEHEISVGSSMSYDVEQWVQQAGDQTSLAPCRHTTGGSMLAGGLEQST